ncbi:MAG: ABC transporter substrate-binding protein [Alphaproteobacteria bacterium]|nr:ABC transporter substrate-binding protein [Alphaproteobacteria bacterium]
MRRRKFVGLLGVPLLLPRHAFGQGAAGMRRIAALFSLAEGDPEGRARVAAFREGLRELGWIEGANLQVDYRWAGGTIDRLRSHAEALVKEEPEVVLAAATTALVALKDATRAVPIIFAQVTDPVGAGFVASLARPGGNITGVTQHEFSIGAKWLELLRQFAPTIGRLAVLFDPGNPASAGYIQVIEAAAPSFRIDVVRAPARDKPQIERAITGFAATPGGGMVLLPGPLGSVHSAAITALAMRHRLPAIYPFRYHVLAGGLASYGVDNIELYRRAAWYVDRVLRGEKPAELPVQNADKFLFVVNLKSARAIGLDPPAALVALADEVIE